MRFQDIPGNNTTKSSLLQMAMNHKFPHALILSGPEGNAKLALALATAQYLNCQNPSETDSCGDCPSCHLASSFTHPDIHFSFPIIPRKPNDKPTCVEFYTQWREALKASAYLDYSQWMDRINKDNKSGNINREECRSIISRLSLRAFNGKNKILVMWLPELLGKEGNHLLKILEEPPANTYFILVSDSVDLILPTVRSRCQMIQVPPFQTEELEKLVSDQLETEAEKVAEAIFMADGNASKLLKILEEENEQYAPMFRNWMLACYKRDMSLIMSNVQELAGLSRETLQFFLVNGLHILRESLMFSQLGEYQTRIPEGQADFVKKFSKIIDPEGIDELYKLLNEGIYESGRNANPKIMLFDISLKIQDIFEGAKKRTEINI